MEEAQHATIAYITIYLSVGLFHKLRILFFTIKMFSFGDLSVTKVEGSAQLHIASAVKLKGIYLLWEASMSHSEKFIEIVFVIRWNRFLLHGILDLCSTSFSKKKPNKQQQKITEWFNRLFL